MKFYRYKVYKYRRILRWNDSQKEIVVYSVCFGMVEQVDWFASHLRGLIPIGNTCDIESAWPIVLCGQRCWHLQLIDDNHTCMNSAYICIIYIYLNIYIYMYEYMLNLVETCSHRWRAKKTPEASSWFHCHSLKVSTIRRGAVEYLFSL